MEERSVTRSGTAIRFLVLGIPLLIVAWVAWSALRPEPEPLLPPSPAPASIPQPNPGTKPDPTPAVAPERRPAPLVLHGRTPFVRRLEAGCIWRRMRKALTSGKASARELSRRMAGTTGAVLKADGLPPVLRSTLPPDGGGADRLRMLFHLLLDPPRDLESLELMRALPGDRLGEKVWVRVWTRSGTYPDAEVEAAERMLHLIAGVAGVPLAQGFDVLITPRMGADVFPRQAAPPQAAGIYFLKDRYCAVRSRLPPSFRREVLRHELVHSYIHRFADTFTTLRFVDEGLAEYLRLLRPEDRGLHVPVARLADNLALLQEFFHWMRKAGIDIRRADPRRLVRISPGWFYALAPPTYLIAQATMAFIGGDVIEKALRARKDTAILVAVAHMDWKLFLEFVRENARTGIAARAILIEDPRPGERARSQIRKALRAIGVQVSTRRLPIGIDDLLRGARLRSPGRIATVIRALRETGHGPVMLFTDLSAAMDRTIEVEVPEAYFGPAARKALEQSRPRVFVGALAQAMRKAAPTVDLRLLPLSDQARLLAAVPDEKEKYSPLPLVDWLNASGWKNPGLILCVAASILPAPRTARNQLRVRDRIAERYARLIERMAVTPRAVLVIDLSEGDGDALALARAFSDHAPYAGLVACWNPQVTPR